MLPRFHIQQYRLRPPRPARRGGQLGRQTFANAHGFIAQLPDAYDTMLGGAGRSACPAGRGSVSPSRARCSKTRVCSSLTRRQRPSSSETEHLIQQAIERLISGRDHADDRPPALYPAQGQQDYRGRQGRIIENGSHDELMALKGKYYKLIESSRSAKKSARARKRKTLNNGALEPSARLSARDVLPTPCNRTEDAV